LEKQKQFVHDARKLTSTIHTMFAADFHHWISAVKAPYPRLKLEVVEAKDLAVMDVLEGTSDPYIKIVWQGEESKTAIKEKTLTPVWKESFEFKLPEWRTSELRLQMFDHDAIGSDEFMGEVSVKPTALEAEKTIDQWVPLMPSKKKMGMFSGPKVKGSIRLRLFLTWEVAPEDEIPDPDTDAEAQFARDVLTKTAQVKEIMAKIIRETGEQMAEKDARIATLEEENTILKQKRDLSAAVLNNREADLKGSTAQIEELKAANASESLGLQKQVAALEAEIRKLKGPRLSGMFSLTKK
jgi:hypothetical protein